MRFPNATHLSYSFVKCQTGCDKGLFQEVAMFARLRALIHLRRSTAFLLLPHNERLLDDIGLTLEDLMRLRQGGLTEAAPGEPLPFVRDIPVAGRA